MNEEESAGQKKTKNKTKQNKTVSSDPPYSKSDQVTLV
jgi:hypothetical protein